MPPVTLEQARAAKQRALERLGSLAQLAGVGITRVGGGYAIKIDLSAPVAPGTALPAEIDGVPVRVEVTGPIRARPR